MTKEYNADYCKGYRDGNIAGLNNYTNEDIIKALNTNQWWTCPVCWEIMSVKQKKFHIEQEKKELKKSLKILNELQKND